MSANLKLGKVRRFVDLPVEDVQWYESAYKPGTLSWLFSMLLKEFKKAHTYTPEQLAAIGAEEVKKLLLNGSVEPEHDDSESRPNAS